MKKKVLLIDDDLKICKEIKDSLQNETTDVYYALSVRDALEQFVKHQFCLVIMDIQLSETDGLYLLEQLRKMNPMPILVLFSKNSSNAKNDIINHNIGLVINPIKRTVGIKREEISLTKREFDILYLLAGNPGVVFSKEQIYAIIWGEQFVKDDSNIMSHIGRLRKKMGEAGKYIQTVWGIGYRFVDGEE